MAKHLNNIKGLVGASEREDGFFKVHVQNESFWVRECKQDDQGVWHGVVDNDLLMTQNHGLDYNDKVTFELIE